MRQYLYIPGIIILLGSFFMGVKIVFAEEIFLFHFVENSTGTIEPVGELSQTVVKEEDPDFSIISEEKASPTEGTYRIELYDITNSLIYSKEFNASPGEFTVKTPYFSIIRGYKVYTTDTGASLFGALLSDYATCNDNGVCEFELGETIWTCLPDCANNNPVYSKETEKTLEQEGGAITDPASGKILLRRQSNQNTLPSENVSETSGYILVVAVVVIIILSLSLIIFSIRRDRDKDYS